MGPKRKRLSSKKVRSNDNKPTTRTKESQRIKFHVGEEVQYDPIHQGSTRRTQGKITKILTGAKKSDPTTKEIRYAIRNDNTGKETIYGQHSIIRKK